MNSEQQRKIGLTSLVLLALAFIAAVIVSNSLLSGMRLDLTENKLYTLSDGTRSLLSNIDEPINLYYFFSDRETSDVQFLRSFATRVQEMLEEFAANSDGKLILNIIDPLPFSEDEDRASQFGLQPVSLGGLTESVYLGLAGTNSVGDQEIIPFFQPTKENFLEYDVARLIYTLANPIKTTIGLYSSLPVNGGFDSRTQQPTQAWAAIDQAEQVFDIRTLAEGFDTIDEDVEVLWLIHPANLGEASLYAIDQFIMRGGRALIFVDPVAEVAGGGANPLMGMNASNSSSLEPLFSAWGIDYDPSVVTADNQLALSINTGLSRPVRHIGLIGLDANTINQEEVITAGLQSINVGVAGSFSLNNDSQLTMTPLLSSSAESGKLPAAQFQSLQDPSDLFDNFTPTGVQQTIAGRLSGHIETAFPDGPALEDATDFQPLLATEEANIVLVADVDILSDRLWVQAQNFLGQQLLTAFASNGDFLVNALDNLSGSAELIGLRSRASFTRPFEKVEELRVAADAQFRATEERLQAELAETERNLGELQAARDDNSSLLMSEGQQRELQRFLDEQVRIRQELRAVRRNLDADIEQLGTRLKMINIGLIPLAVLIFALIRWVISRRPRRSHA